MSNAEHGAKVLVECQTRGHTYQGTYSIHGGLITVDFGDQQKTTQVGAMKPEILARTILGEMVNQIND